MRTFMGIDPGINGSIAVIENTGMIEYHVPTPIIKLLKNDYDISEMHNELQSIKARFEIEICILEKAQAMPGQGVTGMFNYGKGFGIWLALLTANYIPFMCVHPRVWANLLLKGTGLEGKERNYARAIQLFPQWKPELKKERTYADSLLLAEYGRIYK